MKRYTLDQTWTLCLKMWKWITKERKKNKRSVGILKIEWLKNNGFGPSLIDSDCFFCQYAVAHKKRKFACFYCPGTKVDPNFSCTEHPIYSSEPIEFYKLLLTLNRKRKKE